MEFFVRNFFTPRILEYGNNLDILGIHVGN